eukprot:CAMPEP_0171102308 /NCGR_PEP_ID=MMETSP0766_2-20121228/57444_1 /TAXON_ID=439317 /ORGANISM="Gambierdiscus australes, Strain CAWD 149" /LENGTH=393 /DNA_ID=CAMNT_0011562559 /DNA_START=75 /DNA_END=1256 /DNA_ORIENTATION=+
MRLDRGLESQDPDLASRITLPPVLNVRLVQISPADGIDRYHILQVLEASGEHHFYQRWGDTGTEGTVEVTGPMERSEAEEAFAKVFEEKTGHEHGALEPGQRVEPGCFWVQQEAAPDEKAKWQYYVDDGVDGKAKGWYDYVADASDEVEGIFAQHAANAGESRTATRLVHSGYFTYKVDLTNMNQMNTRTKKVRQIRRIFGPPAPQGKEKKVAKSKKPKLKVARLKVAKKVMKKVLKKAPMKKKPLMKKKKKPTMKKKKPPMKKKPLKKKASKIAWGKGKFSKVMKGEKVKTRGGLKKEDLVINKRGKVVSKKRSERGNSIYDRVKPWIEACNKARAELGITGWVNVKKGSELYNKAKEIYGAEIEEPAPDRGVAVAKPVARRGSTKSLDLGE